MVEARETHVFFPYWQLVAMVFFVVAPGFLTVCVIRLVLPGSMQHWRQTVA